MNLDDAIGLGYWVAYAKRNNRVIYFVSFGNLRLPKELERDAFETVDVIRDNNSNNDIDDDGEDEKYPIMLRANYNTMRCEIRCLQN